MQPHLLYFNKHEKMLILADWRFSNSLLHIVPKTNRNLRMKTKPVTAGAYATVYVWFLDQRQLNKSWT